MKKLQRNLHYKIFNASNVTNKSIRHKKLSWKNYFMNENLTIVLAEYKASRHTIFENNFYA